MRASIARWIAFASIFAAGAGVGRAAPPPLVYAYDLTHDHLVSFRADAPGVLLSDVALTGLSAAEYLFGIDFRPATHELFGIASDGRIARVVSIAPATGVVSGIGLGEAAPPGSFAGIDFNPTVDRLRLVTDADRNMRWNPNTGTIALVDSDLSYDLADSGSGADPNVVHLAYVHHGTNPTTVFGIDTARNVLVRLGSVGGTPSSPNLGLLFTIGPLNVDPTTDAGGFDIEWQSDAAYALLKLGATQSLATVDLATGSATVIGATPSDRLLDGIAIPEPDAFGASGAAVVALAVQRRRQR
jgi:Domain of unknown function (DUF4394)